MKVACPFCLTIMINDESGRDNWYTCPNVRCKCPDGGTSLFGKARPLAWIESRHKKYAAMKRVDPE